MLFLFRDKWICQHSLILTACNYLFLILLSVTIKCLGPLLVVPTIKIHGFYHFVLLLSKVYKAQHCFIGKKRLKYSSILASVTVYFCSRSKYWLRLNENQTLHTEYMENENWEWSTEKKNIKTKTKLWKDWKVTTSFINIP